MPSTLDHRDLKRRHPLCPSCGYDLVASIAANNRICPECGEPFDPADLAWERRAVDWSTGKALALAGRALLLRTIIALPVVLVLASLAIVAIHMQLPRIVPFLLALVQASLVGLIFSRRLVDQAGFESVLLIIAACLMAALISGTGFVIAARWIVSEPTGVLAVMHNLIAIMGACVWIVHHLLIDE